MATEPCIIVHVAAEGGGIRLLGAEIDGEWQFRRYVSDWTPELLDEPWVEHTSLAVKGWESALDLLDQYPWHLLAPCEVHEQFRRPVIEAVRERYSRDGPTARSRLERWESACGETSAGRRMP